MKNHPSLQSTISQKSKLLKERTRRILSDVTNVQNVNDFGRKPQTHINKPTHGLVLCSPTLRKDVACNFPVD